MFNWIKNILAQRKSNATSQITKTNEIVHADIQPIDPVLIQEVKSEDKPKKVRTPKTASEPKEPKVKKVRKSKANNSAD